MFTRTSPNLKNEIEKLNDKEITYVAGYISQLIASRIHKQSDSPTNDDLIAALSARRENQRARQVYEWERVRRQNIQRNA